MSKTKKKRKWTRVGMPEKAGTGQRFFVLGDLPQRLTKADIFIADNSGPDPANTDDGPLLWLRDEPVWVEYTMGRLGGRATVIAENDDQGRFSCGFTAKETLWLAEAGATIRFGPQALKDAKVMARLLLAAVSA